MNIEKNLHHIVDTIEKTKQENELSYDITIVAATKTQPFSLIEKIVEILEKDEFFSSRRTVAKYREELKIPNARLRKSII